MTTQLSIPDAVEKIRRDACFWAPERRAFKLMDWLNVYGVPLFTALQALPETEREAIGVNLIKMRDEVTPC